MVENYVVLEYRSMATLDVSGSWETGDEYRVFEALEMMNTAGYLDQLILCMNRLTADYDPIVVRVRAQLTRYETAKSAKEAADLAATEEKTLVKADVLEWEVGSAVARISNEISSAQAQIANYFAFCDYTPPANFFTGGNQPTLYRS